MQYSAVKTFYNMVKHHYRMCVAVLPDEYTERAEKLRKRADLLMDAIDNYPQMRTRRAVSQLFKDAEQIYFDTRNGMQQYNFYFRVTHKRKGSLSRIRFTHLEDNGDDIEELEDDDE